jgi:murein DD-endopeptidase MepM/ murein hydrolase activator NlpD
MRKLIVSIVLVIGVAALTMSNVAPPATPLAAAATSLAKTPTGFYYPINVAQSTNGNWLACGSSYYTNTRHIGDDLFYDSKNYQNNVGKPVYAVWAGTVILKSGPTECSGWGDGNYALAIRHSAKTGDFIALYGHIRTNLSVGSTVKAGDSIGTIGPYKEHSSYSKDSKGNCKVSGSYNTLAAHLHFGIYPSSTGFPSSGWGRITDVGCKNSGSTNGFVAPITWINSKTPKS